MDIDKEKETRPQVSIDEEYFEKAEMVGAATRTQVSKQSTHRCLSAATT